MSIPFAKKTIFSGIATALITPFTKDGVDLDALRSLIDYQIRGHIQALVILGTTGEAPTLTETERDTIVEAAVSEVGGRVPVIVGCGSNDTKKAVAYATRAQSLGADGLLVVTPYYNKGTDRGIVSHYLAVADATALPVILYNVPSRTGVDLTLSQYERLSFHPNIVGVKEAKGGAKRLSELTEMKSLAVYAGNDEELLPALSLGASGLISVLSNLFPSETVGIYEDFICGRTKEARTRFYRLHGLINLLFEDTNPAPVKCAASLLGIASPQLRLPMSEVSPLLRERIASALSALSDIQRP